MISPELEDLQGPSLCVENNRSFSEKDLENISTFASRGKMHERNMIGRFGVGFSTAFGISDCPMIITDEYLYIFDPNKAFINGEEQARRFNLSECVPIYSDQFQPFLKMGCDIRDGRLDGTFIR